jgi:hypothetical protein
MHEKECRQQEDDDEPETICYAKRSRRRAPWLVIVLYAQGGVRAGRGGDLWLVVLPVLYLVHDSLGKKAGV